MFMDYVVSIGAEIMPFIKLESRYLTTEQDIESFRGQYPVPINTANIMSSSKLFNMYCFIENDDIISFKYGLRNNFCVIYFKKTGEVKLVTYLSDDLVYKNNQNDSSIRFLFADAKSAYHVLDPQSGSNFFNNFMLSITNNEVVPDLDKLEQLKQLDEDANPVIFFYEFK